MLWGRDGADLAPAGFDVSAAAQTLHCLCTRTLREVHPVPSLAFAPPALPGASDRVRGRVCLPEGSWWRGSPASAPRHTQQIAVVRGKPRHGYDFEIKLNWKAEARSQHASR